MKPIDIFRHVACEDPGYLGNYLISRNIRFQMICVDQGEEVPTDLSYFSDLIFMGGPMSANDRLSWIENELNLIHMAHQENMPV